MNYIVKKKLFFIIFLLIGCSSKSTDIEEISCPNVLFSSEHRNYLTTDDSEISLNNISYKATINNYNFDKKCLMEENTIIINLSLLFIVQPEKTINKEIKLPYYIAIINENDELMNVNYFQVNGEFDKDIESNKFIETEITDKIDFRLELNNVYVSSNNIILIGFMLDNKKLKILN